MQYFTHYCHLYANSTSTWWTITCIIKFTQCAINKILYKHVSTKVFYFLSRVVKLGIFICLLYFLNCLNTCINPAFISVNHLKEIKPFYNSRLVLISRQCEWICKCFEVLSKIWFDNLILHFHPCEIVFVIYSTLKYNDSFDWCANKSTLRYNSLFSLHERGQ